MRRYVEGSTILLVVFVMSTIIICCSTIWHSTSFLSDMAIQRQKYEQRYRIAEGILKFGIAFCKDTYKNIKKLKSKGKNKFEIDAGFWKIDDTIGYNGKVFVTIKDDLCLQAVLLDDKKEVFRVGCTLSKSDNKDNKVKLNDTFIIHGWKINSE